MKNSAAAAVAFAPHLSALSVVLGAPLMSRCMCCREVRRHYSDSVLPAMFVSSNSRPEHIVDGLAAGAQDYMTKPVNKSELIARVKSHLNSSRMVRASSHHF